MSETTTWWKVARWDQTPSPVTVKRDTDACLFVVSGEHTVRVNKVSAYERHFPSEEEAAGWLIGRAQTRVASARRELQDASGVLGNLKGKYPDHPAFRKGAATS